MSRITSKLQVTVPKAVAVAFGLHPGCEVTFVPAGESIRLVPPGARPAAAEAPARRLALFDEATARQRARERARRRAPAPAGRGWRREDLYDRGLAR